MNFKIIELKLNFTSHTKLKLVVKFQKKVKLENFNFSPHAVNEKLICIGHAVISASQFFHRILGSNLNIKHLVKV